MRELNLIFNKKLKNESLILQKSGLKYIKKLESFVYVPSNFKDVKRLEPFLFNKDLLLFVSSILKGYPIWEKDGYYDIISYWYNFAFLVLSKEVDSLNTILDITEKMIRYKHCDINVLKRTLFLFGDDYTLTPLKEKVNIYFESIKDKIESIKWSNKIGLIIPPQEWTLSFIISTDGERKFPFQMTEEEKEKRVEISVIVYSSANGYGDSWYIRLSNSNGTISGIWSSVRDKNYRIGDYIYELHKSPSLFSFKELIKEIEQSLQCTFIKKIVFSSFSKGIRNKSAVDKWLLS